MEDFNIGHLVKKTLEDAYQIRGHVNVLIAGRTGVGKSTLINRVFQGDFATTGHGRPVTQDTREIKKDGVPLSIFDTRGLEMAEFTNTLKILKDFISVRQNDLDPQKHIHVAWVCIMEDLRRVEDADTALVAMLAKFMPVVVVITKSRSDNGFRAEVQRLIPEAANVVRVRAMFEEFDEGQKLKPFGLEALVKLTMDLIPEAQKQAFAAAQKACLDLKRQRSRMCVATACASAATIAAVPIPFADAFAIVPIQIGMIAGITASYGLSLPSGVLGMIVASVVGGGAATLSGRAIVGGLLKLIPGVGSVIGGAIGAATAVAITSALGEAYIAVLDPLFVKNDGEQPDPQEVLDEVRKRFPAIANGG